MVTIKGTAKKIKKGYYKCPNDDIHRKKDSGGIRGFWAAKIADTYLYYGNWSYYMNTGFKVFYSFKFNKTTKTKVEVQTTVDMMRQLKDFCPEVYYIDEVKTDIQFKERRCTDISPAIYMQHVHYPEKAWLKFAKGKAYNWDADSHPAHSKKGFLEFRGRLEDVVKDIDYNFDHFSIGNIVWCILEKRWYLVDVR
ncbi:MAG: hypothetical protein ACWGNI_00195 [Desulfobacterales bacterium]